MAEPAVSTVNLVQSSLPSNLDTVMFMELEYMLQSQKDILVVTRNDIERENLFVLTNFIIHTAQIQRVINASLKKLQVNWGYHGRGQNYKEGPFDRSVYFWQSYHDGI
ncbi:unnamed protein product [Aspergillus oryzae RIB40]|uniref:DNA, SC012 n=2 Tax=Aspergillus oryzae TaxID=5062 RepID=Q2UBF8_ASPOR|nr:unnamed protein product [Aspergillus oryzae RIB40]KDE77108.1 hypothetical protein AO1008_03161 [Aspergillus oryzae 100-8]BAE61107.1 unnamed protein product [Aspergillus oryzae RIB40]